MDDIQRHLVVGISENMLENAHLQIYEMASSLPRIVLSGLNSLPKSTFSSFFVRPMARPLSQGVVRALEISGQFKMGWNCLIGTCTIRGYITKQQVHTVRVIAHESFIPLSVLTTSILQLNEKKSSCYLLSILHTPVGLRPRSTWDLI